MKVCSIDSVQLNEVAILSKLMQIEQLGLTEVAFKANLKYRNRRFVKPLIQAVVHGKFRKI